MTNFKKSDVWNCFAKVEIMENGVIVTKAKCSVCNKLLSSNTTSGTSHLKRHLSSHTSTQNIDIGSQMQLGTNSSGNLSNFVYDESNAQKETVDFILSNFV